MFSSIEVEASTASTSGPVQGMKAACRWTGPPLDVDQTCRRPYRAIVVLQLGSIEPTALSLETIDVFGRFGLAEVRWELLTSLLGKGVEVAAL